MIRHETSLVFNFPLKDVFEVWADFETWPIWHPVLNSTMFLTDQTRGPGTLRKQLSHDFGLFLVEEFTIWRDCDFVSLRVIDSNKKIFKRMTVEFQFKELEERKTELLWSICANVPDFVRFFFKSRFKKQDDALNKFQKFVNWRLSHGYI